MAVIPTNQPISDILQDFYLANDLPEDGGVNDCWFYLTFGPVRIPIPNTKARREIVYLHDIHHLINDWDTSWKGEGCVSAWEIATGLGRYWTGWALSLSVYLVGVFFYPQATFQAFVRGRRTRGVIALEQSKEVLLAKSVDAVRAETGVHPDQTYAAQPGDRWAFGGWALVGLLLYGPPWLGMGWLIVQLLT